MGPFVSAAAAANPRETLLAEGLVPVPDAALAVVGRRVDPRTALRWAVAGLPGATGKRVRLETLRGPRRARLTSLAAMRRFWLALQDGEPAQAPPAPDHRTPAADEAVLAAFGLGRKGRR